MSEHPCAYCYTPTAAHTDFCSPQCWDLWHDENDEEAEYEEDTMDLDRYNHETLSLAYDERVKLYSDFLKITYKEWPSAIERANMVAAALKEVTSGD